MSHFEVSEFSRNNSRAMRKALTEAELKFWNTVRAHRLDGLSFRRQMPVAGYIVDFACPKHRLIVEIDGPSHSHDEAIERDTKRDDKLKALGWVILRVTNDEVFQHLDEICTHILRVIGERRS